MVYCLDRENTMVMGQVTHDLKTWPEPFEAVWSGRKNFEIRRNDRDFKVGDTLLLREYEPEKQAYTGREVSRVITYIVYGGQWDMPENLSVLGWAVPGCSCS